MNVHKKRTIVPPDQDGRYDMDGTSYDPHLGVVVGSDAMSEEKNPDLLDDFQIVKTPTWRRWLQQWLTRDRSGFRAKSA